MMTQRLRCIFVLGLLLTFPACGTGGSGSDSGSDEGSVETFQAPPIPALGVETIQVVATDGAGNANVIILNGPGSGDDVVISGGTYPLIIALRNAIPGSEPVIGIYGKIRGDGMQIGGGDSDSKAYVAHWGAVPMRFCIVGKTPDATIGELGFLNRMNSGVVNGGVEDARFDDLTIEARWTSSVSGPKGHRFGLIRFYNCHFATSEEGLAAGSYSGFGFKWGVRIRALGRYDFRNCSFDPVLEHAIYIDSPQGDSYFIGIEHNGSTRTAIQVVNRSFDYFITDPTDADGNGIADELEAVLAQYESGALTPQPSGYGRLLFEDITIRDLRGDGGSGITIAGHLGDIIIRGVDATDLTDPFHGVIVIWTDAGQKHGTFLYTGADGGQYSTQSVTIDDVNVNLAFADRAHIAISGCELVQFEGFTIQGNQTAISLDSTYGAAQLDDDVVVLDGSVTRSSELIINGQVEFLMARPVSLYPGFQSTWKIKIGTDTLSNNDIDALWP